MDNLSPPPGLHRSGSTESDDFSIVPQRPRVAGRLIRKTSAEIVSEAKSMLAGGGTRLVSARRPITPREPKRQLYGRVAPPGRPPSAINLKYLQQQESRALPLLEPLHTSGPTASCSFSRSESVDSIDYNGTTGDTAVLSTTVKRREKLPAIIHIPHKGANSLENTAVVGSSNEDKSTYHKPVAESKKTAPLVASTDSIVKNHPLKRMAAQSADDKSPKVETTEPHKGKEKNTLQNQAKLLRRSNEVLVQTSTESLLEMLKAHAGLKECTESDIVHISAILDELFVRVKGSKGSWRGAVLGALYGLVEASSPKILLSVACVVLAMNVTGSNLTGACKLVFKIARNEHNDDLFMGSEVPELLVDGLGRASPIDDSEACIYGYGAVRFLAGSANASNVEDKRDQCTNDDTALQRSLAVRLANHGLGQLMVLHLKMINEAASSKSLTGAPLHALFQLSGALRTLADTFSTLQMNDDKLSDRRPYSGEADVVDDMAQIDQAVPLLVRAAEMCINELEVQANIIRTLSVLSERSECCEQLAETAPRLGILLGSVTQTSSTVEKGLATVNRLGYILGNVMARWDAARVQFYNCDVSCDALLACLDYYANKSFTWKNQMGDSIVNVLTKLIRIVANMCVNGDVGYGMSKRSPLGEILLSVLLKVRDHKTAEMEELLFATLGALHNLSYYYEVNDTQATLLVIPGSICERLKDICGTLCSILDSDYNPARSEVARVLGNMTRSSLVRQVFGEENGLKILKGCLTSGDDELIVTSCGVLVNILGDWGQRGPFQEIDGPSIVRRILRRGVTNRDWIMAAIASQAIWNYLNDTGDILQMLTKSEIDLISGDLAEGLDEESLFHANEPDHFWEDFAPVATDLLERLQFCISEGNSICETSEDEATDGARYG
ncbi:armadillo repeat-containing protein 2 [Anopheles bellator]|uniref:armadillo repeat-containing protein 2 n=1 Tax=Anopheles bellator TaxID=139047 RepID=UPI002647977F|nr:armadillo repeat-containing protein 2 [Anopheles bellator]